jgi:type IV pilus assembly protein PilC
MVFFRQFATSVASGMSLGLALHHLSQVTTEPQLREAAAKAQRCVEGGGQLSRWMRTRPNLFSGAEAALIEAGELGGGLDLVLNRIATDLEEQETLRKRLFLATFIAKFVMLPLLWIVWGSHNIMRYGLQGLAREPGGAGLSVNGQQNVILREGLKGYFYDLFWQGVLIFGVILLLHVAWNFAGRTPRGQRIEDSLRLMLPATGRLWRDLALRRYFSAMGLMTRAGVPLGTAAEACADISGNFALDEKLRSAAAEVRRRDIPVTEALSETGLISGPVLRMLRSGEYSGTSDVMIEQVTRYYESDVQSRLISLPKVIGLLCFSVCAVATLFVVTRFFAMYFNNAFEGAELFMNMK